MPCDKLHKPATKSKCQSIDSPNPHQGMLVGTNTSLQNRPGLDVVGSGAGERKRTMSSRFSRKTRRAGSSSSSSLGLGPGGDSIIFVELKNSEPISMNTRRKDGRISCNYSPARAAQRCWTAQRSLVKGGLLKVLVDATCKKVFERSSLFVEPEAAGSASSPLGEKLTLRIDAQEYSRGCTARVSSYLQSLNGSINLLQPRFPKPGWRNWQTQRTQNPPVLSTVGVQLPLPAP
jgi:hypothetical protein